MTWGLDEVTVRFGPIEALSEISLAVEPGQVAIVVGADGAGKTTMCRTIVGLEEIAGGEVLRPNRIGYQSESSGVWSDLTVIENMEFVAGAYGLGGNRALERIDRLLEVTALDGARDRLGRQLSGGMRQKLGVAMAVLSDPELLVLDEPTTGLDPVSRLELWSFISLSAGEGKAIVVTTTYTDEAQRGNTVLALDSGRELASGTVTEVVASMPGTLFQGPVGHGPGSWRRGQTWRIWSPAGQSIPGATEVSPDLADVVTVAALASEGRG